MTETASISPFVLPYAQADVDDLQRRLRNTRWTDPAPGDAWEYGVDRDFLRDICGYWSDAFNWKRQVEQLSALHHYRFQAGDTRIHFIHERGRGPGAIPLILTHGWPGSFLEMIRILPMLTDPVAHGGDASDCFDVIVPSLPGYGYSDASPTRGMNVFRIADLWVQLMDALGYQQFAAQGGDIGAGVSTALGLQHADRLIGIQLNYIPGSYRPLLEGAPALSADEERFLTEANQWREENGAYAHLQGTRPQTAACGLNDSPAGLAAWMLEKFREWSDCEGDLYRRFTRDELLSNVTLYWMTQTVASSFRLYYEGRRAPLHFQAGDFVETPCGFAHFPKEIIFPPQEWVARGYNVQRWTEMPRGGHFAAAEEPALLAAELRAFFRPLRQ